LRLLHPTLINVAKMPAETLLLNLASGFFVLADQIIPITDIDGSFIMDLNSMEQNSFPPGHFLGSWCLGPVGDNLHTAVYITFIPAIVCTPGILYNMCISTLSHGKWAEEFLLGLN